MNLLVTTAHMERLPIFPLPGLVFFPNTLLPLHVFEPRYRAMIRYCIQHSWPLAVVQIAPGHESEQLGDPPIAGHGGIGHLVMREELDDGRFNIVLQGLARVRIMEELDRPEEPFRSVRARLVTDYIIPDRELLDQKTGAVRSALTTLVARDSKVAEMMSEPLMGARSPAVLADALSAMLFSDPRKRQAMLECNRVDERLDRVLDRLTELLVLSSSSRSEPSEFGAN